MSIIIILTILVMIMLSARLCSQPRQIFWEPTPPENYITAGMIVSTFYIVNAVDAHYAQAYGHSMLRNQQRNTVAFTCMATTIVTHIAIKEIKKCIRK